MPLLFADITLLAFYSSITLTLRQIECHYHTHVLGSATVQVTDSIKRPSPIAGWLFYVYALSLSAEIICLSLVQCNARELHLSSIFRFPPSNHVRDL